MKSRWLILPIGLTLAFITLGHLSSLRSYANLPTLELTGLERRLSIDLSQSTISANAVPIEKQQHARLQLQLGKVRAEIFLRRYHVDSLAYGILIVSLLILVANRLQKRGAGLPLSRDALIRDMSVVEESPREEYVDDWTFEHRTQDGFKTREAAVQWIKSDPVLNCAYCGSRMRSTYVGKRESIQLVTFYKQVPAGAKDMRVVLGTYWFAKSASELVCSGCGRVEKR